MELVMIVICLHYSCIWSLWYSLPGWCDEKENYKDHMTAGRKQGRSQPATVILDLSLLTVHHMRQWHPCTTLRISSVWHESIKTVRDQISRVKFCVKFKVIISHLALFYCSASPSFIHFFTSWRWCAWSAVLLFVHYVNKERDLTFKGTFPTAMSYRLCNKTYETHTHTQMVEWLLQHRLNGAETWESPSSLNLVLFPMPSFLCIPPPCRVCVLMCWRTVCIPVCLCVCLLVWEMMWEQEPCDSFAGCQSLEAFTLGCSENRINMQYLAALVTETWAANAHWHTEKCWSIFQCIIIFPGITETGVAG